MKEIVKKWRLQGLIIFIYIDDILLVGDSFIMVLENLNKIVSDLELLGWLIQTEKSILIPTQKITFLGLLFDLENGKVCIPEDKETIALDIIEKLKMAEIERSLINTKFIAKFIGKLEFLSLAEPAIMPFLDRLRKQMCNRVELKGWNSTMVVNRGPIKDLKFLKNILMNSKGNWLELESPEPIVINSDASLSGFAVHSSNLIVVGQFQEESSINVKELKAINQFFTEASQQELFPRGTHFEIRGDNQPSLVYVKKGYGSIDHLLSIARELWTTLKKKDWHISKTDCGQTKQTRRLEILSRIDKFGRRRIRSSHDRSIRKIRISSNNHPL